MTLIHILRYGSALAPIGSILCWTEDLDKPVAVKIEDADPEHIIHCWDCPEPAVYIGRISYDMGWEERYCENCAYVMADITDEMRKEL